MNKINYVLRINTALANRPFFIKIGEPKMSVDHIMKEAISNLHNQGRPLESQQLEQLYNTHQIFNHGSSIEKGTFFSELSFRCQQLGNEQVNLAEIDLVSSHSGGQSRQ